MKSNVDPKIIDALNRCGRTFIRAQEARALLAKRQPALRLNADERALVEEIAAHDRAHESALVDLRVALTAGQPQAPVHTEPRPFRIGS